MEGNSRTPHVILAVAKKLHEIDCDIAGESLDWDDISPETRMVHESHALELIVTYFKAIIDQFDPVIPPDKPASTPDQC